MVQQTPPSDNAEGDDLTLVVVVERADVPHSVNVLPLLGSPPGESQPISETLEESLRPDEVSHFMIGKQALYFSEGRWHLQPEAVEEVERE